MAIRHRAPSIRAQVALRSQRRAHRDWARKARAIAEPVEAPAAPTPPKPNLITAREAERIAAREVRRQLAREAKAPAECPGCGRKVATPVHALVMAAACSDCVRRGADSPAKAAALASLLGKARTPARLLTR